MTNGNTPGKCIIIGAGGGIGSNLCRRLSSAGWSLVLAGRTEDRLQPCASEYGGEVHTVDARDFGAVEDLFRQHDDATGAVNLAGSILLKPAHSTSQEEFEETVNENLRTAFAVVRAAGKTMRRGGGSVVLMSTCAARTGLPNHEPIAAAKGGVEALMRSAAATYASAQIRFNALAPGLVDSPLSERITGNEASLNASISMHPLGRIGKPDEVARLIAFLLDPESSWITGQIYGIDGGVANLRGK